MDKFLEKSIDLLSTNAFSALLFLGAIFVVYIFLRRDFVTQRREMEVAKNETITAKNETIEAKDLLIADLNKRLEIKERTFDDTLRAKEDLYELEKKKLEGLIEDVKKEMDRAVGNEKQKHQEFLGELQNRQQELEDLKKFVGRLKVEKELLTKKIEELEKQEEKTGLGGLLSGLHPHSTGGILGLAAILGGKTKLD